MWKLRMGDACHKRLCAFSYGCCLPCCAVCDTRLATLRTINNSESGLPHYECFQGYYLYCESCCRPCRDMSKGSLFCLTCESFCCPSFSISATRMLIQDAYHIRSDPCDNRILRFNNCVQCLACVCDILAIFNKDFRGCSQLLDCVACTVWHSVLGCMTGQIFEELEYRDQKNTTTTVAVEEGEASVKTPLMNEKNEVLTGT